MESLQKIGGLICSCPHQRGVLAATSMYAGDGWKYREELTVRDIRRILKKEKIAFDSRAKKKDLLDVLEQHKPKEGLKETLRQPSEHSPRGSTHAPDHPHDYVTKSEDQVQNLTSQTQSTPQAVRTVGEQVPWKHQIQTGITQRESAPDPRKQGLKRRAENEIVESVPGQETRHDVKKRRIEHGQPDRLHSLQGENDPTDDLKRSLKRKKTKASEDNTPGDKAEHRNKRRKIGRDGLGNAPLDDKRQSDQLHPPGLHSKRRASCELEEDAPGRRIGHNAKKRKIGHDNPGDVLIEGKATGVQRRKSRGDSTVQHHESETESDDRSVDTILQRERDRWQYARDGDGDVAMSGASPPAEQVGRGDLEQGIIHENTTNSSGLERDHNDGAFGKANINNMESQDDEKTAHDKRSSQHRYPSQNPNDKSNNPNPTNEAKDEAYDESVRVDVKSFYEWKNGFFRIRIQDPESIQDAEARVEGKMRVKGHTMISLDPIPPINGRPRRYYAVKNSFIPMDPQDIPTLQMGTRADLKELKKGAVPEGACYMILPSHTFKWAGFRDSFHQRTDPTKPTWFPVTECLPRFQANTHALLQQTWKLAGQTEPGDMRLGKTNNTKPR